MSQFVGNTKGFGRVVECVGVDIDSRTVGKPVYSMSRV